MIPYPTAPHTEPRCAQCGSKASGDRDIQLRIDRISRYAIFRAWPTNKILS